MLLFLVSAAEAEEAGPVGGFAGGWYSTSEDNPIAGGPVIVGRLGVKLVEIFDIEAEAGRVEGETRDLNIVYFLYNPRFNTVFHMTPQKRGDLFFTIGAGVQYLKVQRDSESDSDGPQDRALYVNPSQDFVMNAGPGLTLHLAGPLHLRTDLRWYGSFGRDSTDEQPDTFQNAEWTIGFDFRKELPPDIDGDGLKNKYDDCPEEAEDFDDYQDEDGCPELDNDRDGVLDDRDECDDDPEDRDGFEDFDGCPEPDNDRDGVKDKRDKCPMDPEDEDGFEDGDGCPEKDNDEDGFPDKKDRCPDEPETFNGFHDKDGCPDDIPVEIKKFTGVIRGITFETNRAIIRLSSEPTLREALAVFEDYPELRLEVQGHTDDVGNDTFNLDLSQQRAEAVAIWFITHGVDPSRIRPVGYGETVPIADNNTDAGRAENRRVEFKLME